MALRFYVAMLLTAAAHAGASEGEPARFVISFPPGSPTFERTLQALNLAFKRINRRFSLTYVPYERAYRYFAAGEVDGEVGRIATYSIRNPTAIRLEPPLFTFNLVAVSRNSSPELTSWDDARRHRVAYRRGIKLFEDNLVNAEKSQPVDSSEACLNMAKARRVEYCIINVDDANEVLPSITEFDYRVSKLDEKPAYIFLNSKFTALAKELSPVLVDMKNSGDLARIFGPK